MKSTSDKHFEKRDAQTMLKHLLLTQYINNWGEAIGLASNYLNIPRVHYVDCFAGRGEFEDGTEAPPQIAINTLLEMQHTFRSKYKNYNSDFHIHAIETTEEYITLLIAVNRLHLIRQIS